MKKILIALCLGLLPMAGWGSTVLNDAPLSWGKTSAPGQTLTAVPAAPGGTTNLGIRHEGLGNNAGLKGKMTFSCTSDAQYISAITVYYNKNSSGTSTDSKHLSTCTGSAYNSGYGSTSLNSPTTNDYTLTFKGRDEVANHIDLTFANGTKNVTIYLGGNSAGSGANSYSICYYSVTLADACTSITPTFSTDYSTTTLTVGGSNSSAPVINKDGSSGGITWTSSDEDVATVDASGVVTPESAGSARITATVAADGSHCSGSVYKDFTISAGSCNAIEPSLSYASTTLSVGGTSATPNVTGNTGGGAVTYSVTSASPAGCVTVNGSGVVTAAKVGTATITASIAAAGGYCENTATANFTVNCATPTIATQPVADTHCQTDADYELSVTPTAQDGASWSYQWQKSTDNGSSEAFANIIGATSSSYTVPDATLLADTDKQIYYRCVVTCNTGNKSVNSESVAVKALLTPGLSISLKP